MAERIIDYIGESKNKVGYSVVELVTLVGDSTIVDVYHVKTSNIEKEGNVIVWGRTRKGAYYIKAIKRG